MSKRLFEQANLSPELLRAIESMNYTEMTEIQAAAIPLIMQGKDVIGRSSTGTGKTAAFGIPAVESVDSTPVRNPQVLVLSPTRELAMQISDEMRKYAKYKTGVGIATVYGGQSMELQIRQLRGAKIVIGTPGRIMDHMRRHTLRLSELKMVVLDEADEMLNMGFVEDIQTILSEAPEERQTVLFSATMPPAIMKITSDFQKEPEIVAVDKGKRTLTAIEQCCYQVPQSRKQDALNLLLQMHNPKRSLVFCNTKKMVDELVESLNAGGFRSSGLHGDMKQAARTQVMQEFKTGRIRILVATDVAARGIDVEDVEAVYNYDIPQEFEYYIHRIGRTGRAGKTGASHSLVTNKVQIRKIRDIESYVGAPIKLMPIPTAEQINIANQEKFVMKMHKAISEKDGSEWLPFVQKLVDEGTDPVALASSLLCHIAEKERKLVPVIKSIPKQEFTAEGGKNKVWLNVDIGSDQRVAPNFIVGAIVEGTGLPAKALGKIEIYPDHTTVEMSAADANLVIEQMHGSKIKGAPVTFSIKPGTPRPSFGGRRGGFRSDFSEGGFKGGASRSNARPRRDFAGDRKGGYGRKKAPSSHKEF